MANLLGENPVPFISAFNSSYFSLSFLTYILFHHFFFLGRKMIQGTRLDTPPSSPSSSLTLEFILDNRSTPLFQEFADFLQQTFCTENLAFWLAVRQYHDLCCQLNNNQNNGKSLDTLNDYVTLANQFPFRLSAAHVDQLSPSEQQAFTLIQSRCHAIINTYIRSSSAQEINIPCEMRQTILKHIQDGLYHPAIFADATEAVLELMRANSFIPWLTQPNRLSLSSTTSSCSSSSSSSDVDEKKPSVFKRMKRSLLLVGSSSPVSLSLSPNSSRSSGESMRWSRWRKLQR